MYKIFDKDLNIVEVAELPPLPNELQRLQHYGIGEQLNLLYDDVDAGLFGEAARTGQFFQYLKGIKDKFPKNNL